MAQNTGGGAYDSEFIDLTDDAPNQDNRALTLGTNNSLQNLRTAIDGKIVDTVDVQPVSKPGNSEAKQNAGTITVINYLTNESFLINSNSVGGYELAKKQFKESLSQNVKTKSTSKQSNSDQCGSLQKTQPVRITLCDATTAPTSTHSSEPGINDIPKDPLSLTNSDQEDDEVVYVKSQGTRKTKTISKSKKKTFQDSYLRSLGLDQTNTSNKIPPTKTKTSELVAPFKSRKLIELIQEVRIKPPSAAQTNAAQHPVSRKPQQANKSVPKEITQNNQTTCTAQPPPMQIIIKNVYSESRNRSTGKDERLLAAAEKIIRNAEQQQSNASSDEDVICLSDEKPKPSKPVRIDPTSGTSRPKLPTKNNAKGLTLTDLLAGGKQVKNTITSVKNTKPSYSLTDIAETASAVANIIPTGKGELLTNASKQGSPLIFLLCPVNAELNRPTPSKQPVIKQVLALVPSDSVLAPPKPNVDLQDVVIEPPAPVKEVDIMKIINKAKKELPPICKCNEIPSDVHLKGFKRAKMSSCVNQLRSILTKERKLLRNMTAKLERFETNFVACDTAKTDFLPETMKTEVEDPIELSDDAGETEETATLPSISEVVSKVNEEVLNLKKKQESNRKNKKTEEALKLIKQGLEMIQSWSREANESSDDSDNAKMETPSLKRVAPKSATAKVGEAQSSAPVIERAKRRPKPKVYSDAVTLFEDELNAPSVNRQRKRRKPKTVSVPDIIHQLNEQNPQNAQKSGDDFNTNDLLLVRKVDILNDKVKRVRKR